MNTGKTMFAQIMDFLPWKKFERIVQRYDGDRNVRSLSCSEQFKILAFAQLTYRESLRDIEACLEVQTAKLYHMGLSQPVSKSTLADANENRDWKIYAEFAQYLILKARKLYADDAFDVDLKNTVYALDSTTIDLCLSVFPWAHFRRTKSAIKLHTLLDLRGNIPSFIHISDGKMGDVNILDLMIIEAGSYYVMDRAYLDFSRLYGIHQNKAFFVTRLKSNVKWRLISSESVDKTAGFVCDQKIKITGKNTSDSYPEYLRRIRFKDPKTGKRLIFLTNDFNSSAFTIAALYKNRWQVELFFKWIKQHLRIKKFYGTSENAVKTQIWTAVSIYVLVAIVKKELKLEQSLYTLLQILSVSIFEKIQLQCAFAESKDSNLNYTQANQLNLLEF
jgi:hypothetical protein